MNNAHALKTTSKQCEADDSFAAAIDRSVVTKRAPVMRAPVNVNETTAKRPA